MISTRRQFSGAFLLALVLARLGGIRSAGAAPKPRRVAVAFWSTPLGQLSQPGVAHPARALGRALAELGWLEGSQVELLFGSAAGDVQRMGEVLDGFIAQGVDVIVVTGNIGALEARKRTRSIPIVMSYSQAPVKVGLVRSAARPGGNLTGLVGFEDAQLYAKRLSLLLEADSRVRRVAFMTSFESINGWEYAQGLAEIAAGLGLSIFPVALDSAERIEEAFGEAVRSGASGVYMDSELSTLPEPQARIGAMALRHRLPVVYSFEAAARYGGLIVYDQDRREAWNRVAHFVDRVLRGADPGELPLEQAGRLRLVVNSRAARDIGLTLPKSLLRQADEVID
jgi:putative ABC transport system substrate-binding protein